MKPNTELSEGDCPTCHGKGYFQNLMIKTESLLVCRYCDAALKNLLNLEKENAELRSSLEFHKHGHEYVTGRLNDFIDNCSHLESEVAELKDQLAERTQTNLIYIASPYTDPDPFVMHDRFLYACHFCFKLIASGCHVFSPIVHCHSIAMQHELRTDYDYWKSYNCEMISKACKLVVLKLDGWDRSKGIAGEVEIAEAQGIPVEYADYPGKFNKGRRG